MFTEINLTINADCKTSTGGTINGSKVKILAGTQSAANGVYSVGGIVHETQEAEDDDNCECIKLMGLAQTERRSAPGTPQGEGPVAYYPTFGLNCTAADFTAIDTEAKRITLVKTAIATALSTVEGQTIADTDIV